MIVYQESKKQFLYDVKLDLIEDKIEQKVREKLNKKTVHNEYISWMNSMQYMYKVMEDKNIPEDSKIAIEYRIPNSNKRVDFKANVRRYLPTDRSNSQRGLSNCHRFIRYQCIIK